VSKVPEGRLCFRSDIKGSRIQHHVAKFIGQKRCWRCWVAVGICRSVFALRPDSTCISLVGAHLMSRVLLSGVGVLVNADTVLGGRWEDPHWEHFRYIIETA
jgi:hypothetical protein